MPREGRDPTLKDLQKPLIDRGTTSWYLPQGLVLLDHLERDPAGKVDKRRLRDWIDR